MAKFTSPDLANNIADYIHDFQSQFRKLAIEAYKRVENSDITIYNLLKKQEADNGKIVKFDKMDGINNLTPEQKIKYFDIYGKIYDLSNIAIKASNDIIVKEYEKEFEKETGKKTGSSADNLEYTIDKIMSNERFSLDEKVALMVKAYVNAMLTGHPTDPTSFEHKLGLVATEKFVFNNLNNKNFGRDDANEIINIFKDYFSISVTAGKKLKK